jgi:O-antigen ligase
MGLVVVAATAVGLGAGLDPKVTVAVAVGVCALVAIVLRPDWLPAALIVTVFIEGIALGGVQISRLAAPVAGAVVVVRLATGARVRFPSKAILLTVGAYTLWAFASVLWTVNSDHSFHHNGAGYAVASLGIALIYLAATAVLVQTHADLRRLMGVTWLMAVVVGFVAISEYLAGGGRAVGYTGDANFFAAMQVIALPLGVALASDVERGGTRLLVLLGCGVITGSIFTSLSRGGVLALSGIILVLAMQPAGRIFRTAARKRAFFAMAALGGALLLSVSYGALSQRTASLFHTGEGGSGRQYLWAAALTGFREHPVTGLGYGAFDSQSNFLLERTPGVDFRVYRERPTGQVVHSAYLSSLTELGVVGLALFAALLVATFATLRRVARRAEAMGDQLLATVARALTLSLIAFMLVSIFLSSETDRALWILMGLALALARIGDAQSAPAWQSTPTPQYPGRRAHVPLLASAGQGAFPGRDAPAFGRVARKP